jgi:glycerol-3-phosphate dehydrogenase subunit B
MRLDRVASRFYLAGMRTTDVLVLGGGVAGAAAALSAAAAGARAVLVRSGPGATAVSAGGWVGRPPDALREILAAAGLPLQECTAPLPHPDGRLLRYEAAPPAQARAALQPDVAQVLVCGIAGLPTFRAAALAALWTEAGGLRDNALASALLQVPGTPAAGWSPVALAAHIEREPGRLASVLAEAVRQRGATRVIVPAVLGVEDHARVLEAVTAAAGVQVGEALGAAPSLPGWRVDRALLRALQQAGIEVVTGLVTEHVARDGMVQLVTVANQATAITIRATAVVLATGKFLGGGISSHGRFIDTALRTELTVERGGHGYTDPADSLALTDAVSTGPQPLLTAGVRANGESQPINPSGDVIFRNVIVAGSVRAGTETASFGLGNAARDGWEAGERAAGIATRA